MAQSSSSLQPMSFQCSSCSVKIRLFENTPESTGRKAYLTNCYHFMCQGCHARFNSNCLAQICKKPCQIFEITPNMPSSLLAFVQPVERAFQQTMQVAQFQQSMQEQTSQRLKMELQIMQKQYEASVASAVSVHKKLDEKNAEYQKLLKIRHRVVEGMKALQQQQLQQRKPSADHRPHPEHHPTGERKPIPERRASPDHLEPTGQHISGESRWPIPERTQSRDRFEANDQRIPSTNHRSNSDRREGHQIPERRQGHPRPNEPANVQPNRSPQRRPGHERAPSFELPSGFTQTTPSEWSDYQKKGSGFQY